MLNYIIVKFRVSALSLAWGHRFPAAAAALLLLAVAPGVSASGPSEIYLPAAGFKKNMLSDYHPPLKGTPADSPVYVQQGGQKGGTVFVAGGTHANEAAGTVAAALLLENARVKKGRLIILPRANMLASLHSAPRQREPLFFSVDLPGDAKRWFRYGSRYSDPRYAGPADSQPASRHSGGKSEIWERGNLNRCYPGHAQGSLTGQTAFAIMRLIKGEKADLAIDLHEAREKSILADMAVVHERALEFAAEVLWELSAKGVEIRLEASPKKTRGLSHREWGDHTGALAVLLETRNPIQINYGDMYGAFVLQGRQRDQKLCAQFDRFFASEEGKRSLALRVGRHVAAVAAFIEGIKPFFQANDAKAAGSMDRDKEVVVEGIPSLRDIQQKGLGAYLSPPSGK